MPNLSSTIVDRWAWLPLLAVILLLLFALDGMRLDTQSLRGTAESFERQASDLPPPSRTIVAPPASPVPPPPASVPAVTASAKPGALNSFSDRNAMGEQEYGDAIARRHRRYALANYRPAIASLHLSPADEGQLKELIAAEWIAREDAGDVLDRMGDATPELRAKAREAVRVEGEQKVKALLGDEAYDRLLATYDSSTTEKMNWMLATDLWDAGLPLTPDQQSAYARAERQVRAGFPTAPNRDEPPDPATGLTARDIALIRSVESFLSPAQLDYIRNDKIAEARLRQAQGDLRRAKSPQQAGP